MTWKIISLCVFGILSTICFLTECYEIFTGEEVYWSDHLHNLLDHAMFVTINYIGFKVARSS
jgi:hypothetical protein